MIQRDRRKRSYMSQNAKKTPLRNNGTLLSQIPLLSQVLCDKRGILKFRRLQKSTVRYQQVELFLPVDWPLTALGCSMTTHHCLRLRNLRAHYSIGLFQPACHYRICPRFFAPLHNDFRCASTARFFGDNDLSVDPLLQLCHMGNDPNKAVALGQAG